ncbi:unnamed protein product [Rotaria sp. Silwood2]|nr:unnamed protein product [Rotaria sp. Silwood2]
MSTALGQRKPEKLDKSKGNYIYLWINYIAPRGGDTGFYSSSSSSAIQSFLNDAQKGKAGGKGTKAVSPVLDGPTESDTSRPLDSEEIQALAIRLDELEKLRQDKNEKKTTEEHQQKSFIVKKTKTGPQKQPIQVAKIAPQQPVQEQLISSGIRFDSSGNLLPYSILGTVNDYVGELPDAEAAELCTMGKDKKTAEDIPEVGTYDKKNKQRTSSPDGGGRSLQNWKFRMDERRQVMKNMSSKLLEPKCFSKEKQ